MFSYVQNVFVTAAMKMEAREEALIAIRTFGSGAKDHLEERRRRNGSRHRRLIYRLAIAVLPELKRGD
jgi:hypothetical protein